jgi:regulatory protein
VGLNITSAVKNKKLKDKMDIFIDEKYFFTISESDYISLNLYDKTEITQEEIEYIKNSVNFRAAKSLAVKFLSIKLRTEAEVEKKLSENCFELDTIKQVIEELRALGYINNRLYVQKYIFDRSKLKPVSKKLLKFELLGKGITESIIDEEMEGWLVDEASIAEGLVKKKFGKYDLNDDKILRRVYSFLNHRGFSRDLIMHAIDKVREEKEI